MKNVEFQVQGGLFWITHPWVRYPRENDNYIRKYARFQEFLEIALIKLKQRSSTHPNIDVDQNTRSLYGGLPADCSLLQQSKKKRLLRVRQSRIIWYLVGTTDMRHYQEALCPINYGSNRAQLCEERRRLITASSCFHEKFLIQSNVDTFNIHQSRVY